MRRWSRTAQCQLALALSLCVPGTAQEERPDITVAEAKVLKLRGREILHPDDPFDVRGSEEEGNGFRHRTPGLAHTGAAHKQVDLHELYPRRIAMIEGAARYRTSLPLRPQVLAAPPSRTSLPAVDRATTNTPSPAESPRGQKLMFQVCSLSLLLCMFMLKRWSG